MDISAAFHKKSRFLEQLRPDSLVIKLQEQIQRNLLGECDVRIFSPGMIRATTFDLSYTLLRHRAWHNAPLLSEFAIDYLNSEYLLPRAVATMIVESALDLLHSYTPAELDWDANDYEKEFLEHLFVCSVIASEDAELAADIGFGRNVIELLKSAMNLGQSCEELFQFAPDLALRLHDLIQGILAAQAQEPWTIDLYKLKNWLQRDPYIKKSSLSAEYLAACLRILLACGPGGASLPSLEHKLKIESLRTFITVLQRIGLVYEELQSAGKPALYRLSHLGFELTASKFIYDLVQDRGFDIELKPLPAAYQANLLQGIWQHSPEEFTKTIMQQSKALSPDAVKMVIEYWKKQRRDETLLELFENMLHNRVHAWLRVQICHALPLQQKPDESKVLLESLAEHDHSPMVRNAARMAMKRQPRLDEPTRA